MVQFRKNSGWDGFVMKNKTTQHFLWRFLPAAALLIWGALCLSNNLWYDEAYSASMVSLPWERLLYITAVDDHSPFYYVLLKIFYHLFGGGTRFVGLKLMSLLFMMGYIFLGKYYVKKLFDEKVSVWFMIFSILMPIMSVQAGNVRMYATALFFLTLTGLSAYDIFLDQTGGKALKRKWFVFCGASICTVYCHTFALIQTFLFYLLFLGTLLYSRQRKKIKPFFISGIVVSVVFSPWLLVTLRQMLLRMRYDTGSMSEMANMYSFMDYCKEWFSALETPIEPVVFVGMGLAIVLGYYAVDWMRANHNFAPAVGMGALGLTALCGGLISTYLNNCFLGRYAFPGFGFLMLFYAVGMCRIGEADREARERRQALEAGQEQKDGINQPVRDERKKPPFPVRTSLVLAAALFCFLLQYRSELSLEYDRGLQTYEGFIDSRVTQKDVFIGPYTHTIFLNVYHPELQYYLNGYKLYSLPFVNTEALTDYSQLDPYENLWYICFQGGTPNELEDEYDYEEALEFHYMYYDFVIYRLEPKTIEQQQ